MLDGGPAEAIRTPVKKTAVIHNLPMNNTSLTEEQARRGLSRKQEGENHTELDINKLRQIQQLAEEPRREVMTHTIPEANQYSTDNTTTAIEANVYSPPNIANAENTKIDMLMKEIMGQEKKPETPLVKNEIKGIKTTEINKQNVNFLTDWIVSARKFLSENWNQIRGNLREVYRDLIS